MDNNKQKACKKNGKSPVLYLFLQLVSFSQLFPIIETNNFKIYASDNVFFSCRTFKKNEIKKGTKDNHKN